MDFDMDTYYNHMFSVASPNPSSFLPFSPLWTFTDYNCNNNDDDDEFSLVETDDFAQFESSRKLTYTNSYNVTTDSAFVHDENRKLSSPLTGFLPDEKLEEPCVIKERMAQALRYFKDLTEQQILAQVWAPVKIGSHYFLTTSGQPFVLDPSSNGLHQYRLVSLMYTFSVDGDRDGVLGLPGRVFRHKLPEWTPNVQYYSSKEFPRLNHALHYNVRGTLALPVFERSGQSCVGVLELIMTSPKINYAPEVDRVCKALEAVNLKSSDILEHRSTQICNEGRQNALEEILEIITVVCETHSLPLAQTWVPCRHRNVLADGGGLKKTCSSFDGSCMGKTCMSTTDVAFYVVDAHLWGFREACTEHHLREGQGVAGRAFSSHSLSFCEDIKEFCKNEYPLVHYARMFELTSSLAICLRSRHTGNDKYVIEFFLPSNINFIAQRKLLNSLLVTMKEHFGTLQVASGKDLDREWRSIEIIKASIDDMLLTTSESPPRIVSVHSEEKVHAETFAVQEALGECNDQNVNENYKNGENFEKGKQPARKRGKVEKTISLDILQQYFAGSLKDAAKSLGVCPTTMKRICRQHGISRWPSRKISKVNRSLSKLQSVIESVQTGKETFGLTSLHTSSVPVAVNSISWPANLNDAKQLSSPNSKPPGCQENRNDEFIYTPDVANGQTCSPNHVPLCSITKTESTGTPTSQGSCQDDPVDQNFDRPHANIEKTEEFNLSLQFSTPEPFKEILLEERGSSHDLRSLCPDGEPLLDTHLTEYSWTKPPLHNDSISVPADQKPQFSARQEVEYVTIKATYRDNIIRFRLNVDSGIVKLKEEVAKRLKLEIMTFDINYFDDDQEWVLIACDTDFSECVDVWASSGNKNVIRLQVHDTMPNLGSSCESIQPR